MPPCQFSGGPWSWTALCCVRLRWKCCCLSRGALRVVIHQGKNRQIRRMCAQAGLDVRRLQRVREGTLELGGLPVGRWRRLDSAEIRRLEGR